MGDQVAAESGLWQIQQYGYRKAEGQEALQQFVR